MQKSGVRVTRDATKEMRTIPKARRHVWGLSSIGASRTANLIGDSDRLHLALDPRRIRARDLGGIGRCSRLRPQRLH